MAAAAILISRTDRAGDLVLTLPAFREIRRWRPDCRLVAHVRSYTAPLVAEHPDVDGILADDAPDGRRPSLLRLAQLIRRGGFAAALLVHPAPRAMLACWLARVPVRVGRASNLWQVFLTHRVVQHRSRNEHHEAWYNRELARAWLAAAHGQALLADDDPLPPVPWLRVGPERWAAGRAALDRAGLEGVAPVIVHPGHGGSAVNLPLAGYRQLVDRLLWAGQAVAVTLGRGEAALAEEFPPPQRGRLGFVADVPDLGGLLGVLAHGRGFLGGSTGPMHMAAALGLPTVAFFPLLPAMTPKRWGPVGERCLVVQPADPRCPGRCAACARGNCLAGIDLDRPLAWLEAHLKGSGAATPREAP
jgi:ADP-heptose:LPS heptosyltransferase